MHAPWNMPCSAAAAAGTATDATEPESPLPTAAGVGHVGERPGVGEPVMLPELYRVRVCVSVLVGVRVARGVPVTVPVFEPEMGPLALRVPEPVLAPDGEPVRESERELVGEPVRDKDAMTLREGGADPETLAVSEGAADDPEAVALALGVSEGDAECEVLSEGEAERDAVGDRETVLVLPDGDDRLDGEALGAHGSRLMPRENTGSPASRRGVGRPWLPRASRPACRGPASPDAPSAARRAGV